MDHNSAFKQIPQTGRIGRLVKILKTKIDEEAFLKILVNANEYESLSAQDKE